MEDKDAVKRESLVFGLPPVATAHNPITPDRSFHFSYSFFSLPFSISFHLFVIFLFSKIHLVGGNGYAIVQWVRSAPHGSYNSPKTHENVRKCV